MRRPLLALLAGLLVVAGSPFVLAASPIAPAASARTWGDDPLDEVFAAADSVDRCGLNRNQFVAAMLAPSWPETGASGDLSPSPMTLSRWDAQSALFAFGDSNTPYRRAFWHPGVGLWQFDSAGLGAPYTASQRIDIRVIATSMANTISARYCGASGTPGHRLEVAWGPWHGCNEGRCLVIFAEIYNPDTGQLRTLARNGDVTSTGGMQPRTCRGPGVSGTFSCWRVDPSLAQGYGAGGVAWADPNSGASAPLTAPFYVYAAGGYEYRHWLRSDTGYSTGIWARRPIGQNARTSLQWAGGESLCDVTTGRGACCPTLPVNYSCVGVGVGGSYTPVAGDFNGDGVDDIIWYAPGDGQDYLWQGTVFGRFLSRQITVSGAYTPIPGDFDGNGTDDVLWYAPGGDHNDRIWRGKRNGTFRGSSVNVTGTFTAPAAADFNGDRKEDIIWYGDGTAADYVWYGTRGGFTSKAVTQNGVGLTPLAANYDGDERADIFWYGPDDTVDKLWYGKVGRTFGINVDTQIGGTYVPVAGRFNRGRTADILWYRPGEESDVVYFGSPERTFEGRAADIDETFIPFSGDFNGNGVDDVFWYGPGAERDSLTLGG
jgi:hypothetical protein